MKSRIASICGFVVCCWTLGSPAAPVATFFQASGTAQTGGGTGAVVGGAVMPGGGSQVTPRNASPRAQTGVSAQQKQPSSQEGASKNSSAGESGWGNSSSAARPGGGSRANSGASGPGIKFNFKDAPIDRVINSIMQELGHSYVIDPKVDGTVNIFTMREIPREELFGVLEQLLKMNGQAIIKQDDMYVIVPINESPSIPHEILMSESRKSQQQEAPAAEGEGSPAPGVSEGESEEPPVEEPSQEGPPASPGAPLQQTSEAPAPEVIRVSRTPSSYRLAQEGVITYIIPLHYFPSDQMIQMAQAFLSPGATVVDFQPANMIILTDYPKNVEQVLNLVSILDTRYFEINSVDLIPIRFNQAKDVAEDLGKIFAPGETATGVRIVAIERLNSILVVTRSAAVFDEVKSWLSKLDAPSASSNMKTYVYHVENSTAVQIAQILAELYQDGSGLPSAQTGDTPTREGSLQPGGSLLDQQRNQRMGTRGDAGFVRGGDVADPRNFGTGNLGMRELGPQLSKSSYSQISAVYAGNVKIVVNEFNNSLIIQGTEADIQFMLETVRQLDLLPRQVMIEAQIFGVELRDELAFGVSAFLQQRGTAEGPATTGSISAPAEGSAGGALAFTTRAIIGRERELLATINALRTKTNVEVLDAPRVLALDGTPASINIGAEVPVTSASFGNPLQSGTTNFVNSIQFRPTGTTLLIVPRVTASGIVTMDVVLEVSDATGPALTPTINRTYIQSSFIVRDGQTVAIAGLMSGGSSISKSRVPLLGDIPIVGALFGQTETQKRRRELVVFITPSVVRTLPTVAELTLEFKRALKNSYDFINRWEAEQEEMIQRRREEELKNNGNPAP